MEQTDKIPNGKFQNLRNRQKGELEIEGENYTDLLFWYKKVFIL